MLSMQTRECLQIWPKLVRYGVLVYVGGGIMQKPRRLEGDSCRFNAMMKRFREMERKEREYNANRKY